MIELRLPENYASAYTGAIYEVESASTTKPCSIEVIDVDAGATIGVRRVQYTNNNTINIGRYLSRVLDPKPIVAQQGFVLPEGRDVGISLLAEEEMCEVRRFTSSLTNLSENKLLSTLTSRTIAAGDSDEISLFAKPGKVTISVFFAGEQQGQKVAEYQHGGGLISYLLNLDMLLATHQQGEEVKHFRVVVAIDGATLAEIEYTVRLASPHNVRLAWLNPYGAIDYYTFISLGSLLRTEKERIVGSEGVRVVCAQGCWEEVLSSGYIATRTARALSSLLSSPRVWRCDGEKLGEVDLTEESMTISDGDSLTALRVVIREAQPLVTQIF